MSIYVCSDIHGQGKLFDALLKKIGFSKDDHLYILGDVIDRGPDSIELLKKIMSYPNMTCLLGNHELMMYTEYIYPYKTNTWIDPRNGGNITKRQFEELSEEEQKKILEYIGNMYLQKNIEINGKNFLLSHSDFYFDEAKKESPDVKFCDVEYYTAFKVAWNSQWRFWEYVSPDKYLIDKKIHITGHVPVDAIFELQDTAYIEKDGSLINIDLGCARIGRRDGNYALCVMNLTEYAKGNNDCFKYAFWKDSKKIGIR